MTFSNQVLRLLERVNFWSELNTFSSETGVELERATVPLADPTDKLENIGGSLYFNGTLLANAAASGTVTSVGLSAPAIFSVTGTPVTSTGTLALSLVSQSANTVFAGPTSGGGAAPTFRALVAADLPTFGPASITWAMVDKTGSSLADLTTRSAADLSSGTLPDARFPATLPIASGVNLTDLVATQLTSGTIPDARFPATLPAASGVNLTALNASNLSSGTVAAARMPAFTGDATSSAGATALTLATSGVTAASYGDATHVAQVTFDAKGRATTAASVAITFPTVSLTSGVSGVLPIANGGTGKSTLPTDGQLLIGKTSDNTWNLATLTGTANQVVVTGGAGSITLSTPQSIGTASTPQFARIGLGTGAGGSAVLTTAGQINTGLFAATSTVGGTLCTFNWANGMVQSLTMTAACTFTFSNPITGVGYYRIFLLQDGTGGWTVTWPGTVKWSGGVAPTLSAANKMDILTFFWNGTSYYGTSNLNY